MIFGGYIKAIKTLKSGTVYFPLFRFSVALYIVHRLPAYGLYISPSFDDFVALYRPMFCLNYDFI